uniref:Uncharacterized protein n=1 Tax=Aegilops tauschii subsp. strangulata TaxID=200361 RepID=A0A453KXJ6_AEGTS
ANASDAILCTVLGQNAVHGAFAGFSGITSGCGTDVSRPLANRTSTDSRLAFTSL